MVIVAITYNVNISILKYGNITLIRMKHQWITSNKDEVDEQSKKHNPIIPHLKKKGEFFPSNIFLISLDATSQ